MAEFWRLPIMPNRSFEVRTGESNKKYKHSTEESSKISRLGMS